MRGRLRQLITLLMLSACTGLLALPFFWMVATSLKTGAELAVYPPTWLPHHLQFYNYVEAWRSAPFGRFYLNSLLVGAGATFCQVLFALMMAYAFAVVRFPASRILFLAVLATMMIPDEMKLVPNYMLMNQLGLTNTYPALLLPALAHAFPVFVLYQHFRSIPRGLIEAAQADGASHLRILFTIVTPISRPMVAAAALMVFLGRWNDYLWPLIVTNSTAMRTLPIGLAYLKGSQESGNRWNILMAAAVFVIIPILTLYVAVQRQFVEGMVRGALKG